MARKLYKNESERQAARGEKQKDTRDCILQKMDENRIAMVNMSNGESREYDISRVAEDMVKFVIGLPVGGQGVRVQQAQVIAPLPPRR